MIHDGSGAFEWGLASIGIGGVLLLAAVIAMAMYPPNPLASSDEWYEQAATLSLVAFLALSSMGAFAGITFGLRSMMLARRIGRPLALGLSGVMLGILAVVAWSSLTFVWIINAME